MFSIKGLAVWGFVIAAAVSAGAQAAASGAQLAVPKESLPKVEIAVDYSYMRANAAPGQCGCFNLNGGSAEVAVHAYRNFSLVADITGEHAGTTSIPGQSLSLLSYTGGPRFSYPIRRSQHIRATPFVQGLVGAVHGFDGQFPNSAGTLGSSAYALAVLAGGGVDITVGHRFALRAVQVDYGLDHLPNNVNNTQNLLRVSTGVVFRIH